MVLKLVATYRYTTRETSIADAMFTVNREDPSFRFTYNEETGETIIAGMGELHLEIIRNKLVRDRKLAVRTGTPRVSYRETITGSAAARL